MKTFKTFIERPEFCDVPGGVKNPALKARCSEPEKPKSAELAPDIRSKELKDKKDKWKKLGLTTKEQQELEVK